MQSVNNLVLCMSGPYGSGSSTVKDHLIAYINDWPGCYANFIDVAKLIKEWHESEKDEPQVDEQVNKERRKQLQNIGTYLRKEYKNTFVGKLISSQIYYSSYYIERDSDENLKTVVHIVDSIKNPYEFYELKKIYSNEMYLLYIYAERENRWRRMVDYKSWNEVDKSEFEYLDLLDQNEKKIKPEVGNAGQQVEKLATLADFYIVNDQNLEKTANDARRFVNILFGNGENQPTVQESCMHIAYSASNNSFCLSRQVGATIIDSNNNILSIGHNDVPKARGGLYSNDDEADYRCYVTGERRCINDTNKEERFDEISKKICESLGIDYEYHGTVEHVLRNSSFKELIEYCRAVHAEMDAILKVARTGSKSLIDSAMYVTTEPCHSCVKHIICSGISKVVFMEPYPKSLGLELHSDSITSSGKNEGSTNKVIFCPYEGISPHRFHDFFAKDEERKDENGKFIMSTKLDKATYPKFAKYNIARSRLSDELDPITQYEAEIYVEICDYITSQDSE